VNHPEICGIATKALIRGSFIDVKAVSQCDSVNHGLPINALVPATHYLNTPGGPLSFSLEGHPRLTSISVSTWMDRFEKKPGLANLRRLSSEMRL
jgi:hypothetical protein